MALNKTPIDIAFAQGLDQKIDPFRLPIGKFQVLENSVFNKGGQLTKRNGYGFLSALPNTTSSYLTTLNNNLTAIGPTISAYNEGNQTWVQKGTITPLSVSTLPTIRNNLNQTQVDSVVAQNGLICTVYSELNDTTTTIKYAIADSVTGQNIVAPTALPITTSGQSPRVFLLGAYFVIVYTNVATVTPNLQYITVSSTSPTVVTSPQTIATGYEAASTVSWDGVVANTALYIAYDTTAGGQAIKITALSLQQAANGSVPAAAKTFAGQIGTIMSLTADITNPSNPIIYASYYDSGSSTGYSLAVDQILNTVMLPTQFITTGAYLNLASSAQNGVVTIYSEADNNYSYDSAIPSHFIVATDITKPATVTTGTVGSPKVVIRSAGLASKAFLISGTSYLLVAYESPFQSTYFLVNGTLSTSANPVIVSKLAYENGGGYCPIGLPSAIASGENVSIAYRFKDLIEALNTLNNPQQTTAGGIYAQTGLNVVTIDFTKDNIDTAEIASSLHLSGGFMGMYDGYLPVEHNFFVWPDSIEATWSATGGSIHAQPDGATNASAYYYQVTYEWSDNNGNIYRSAPSIPVPVTTTGSGTAGSITVNVPTLRLTMKTQNPVKIVIYRWSVANQIYYQVTSITAPTLNSTTTDSISYVDTLADSSIIGNNIIYTTGGVIEDINAPATNILTLFDTRLWLVDAEDPNLLWYSKQVIEATPVEMSDLFTIYVAPNTGTASSTGPITALSPMDDKLIIFKKDAIYYLNGAGPDNTGANSQYSQPIFITSTVGCNNQQSVVLTPDGLMFQSDKGIWLLGRGLNTTYIGSSVADFNTSTVNSAVNVPQTNQIRFTLDTGKTLMYDYYYSQWGVFKNVPAVSSCIYNGLHTYINSFGTAFQETPGAYIDGTNPVLLKFTTGWINVAGLQGFERAYYFYLLGTYLSPHKLQLQIAYDYNGSPYQSLIVQPTNFSSSVPSPFGDQSAPFGASGNLEQWRIFLDRQKCQAFQITMNEIFDPSLGVPAGAGLTLSGLNLIVAVKKGYRPIKAANSAGGNS